MRFKHTHRPGFWLGFIDFFTAGLFFLLYMPFGGLQEELDEIEAQRIAEEESEYDIDYDEYEEYYDEDDN